VRTQVASAHRRIDELLAKTRALLGGNSLAAAARDFEGLREALQAHFLQEESLYYPPIVSLRPETKGALEAAIRAHADFRASLSGIADMLARGLGAEADRALAAFEESFARHEAAEEDVLGALEDEPGH
jgi:hypothetical protein